MDDSPSFRLRVFPGRFFARGPGPSPTTDLHPPIKTYPTLTPLTCELVATPQVHVGDSHTLEHLDIACVYAKGGGGG